MRWWCSIPATNWRHAELSKLLHRAQREQPRGQASSCAHSRETYRPGGRSCFTITVCGNRVSGLTCSEPGSVCHPRARKKVTQCHERSPRPTKFRDSRDEPQQLPARSSPALGSVAQERKRGYVHARIGRWRVAAMLTQRTNHGRPPRHPGGLPNALIQGSPHEVHREF